VYLDFSRAISEQGKHQIEEKYGNLFRMYEKITGISAYTEPMRISPAAHFSMGGLWVDYELMTNVSGLYAVGEANFADHGATRLGANSLLQACVDGYFIAPSTIPNYLANEIRSGPADVNHSAFATAEEAAVRHCNGCWAFRERRPPIIFIKPWVKFCTINADYRVPASDWRRPSPVFARFAIGFIVNCVYQADLT
jgi:succinate dehydrogenase / fumarate reductase flavoprotein subunit